ncbi:MAG: hypothetical protein A3J85_07305 [Desulfobacula sp. RIFOXYA12_FULL_46_16]|nr:MAG: hypothetical protein A2464_10430 [Deltaproteobacteria bacterium RIFOXYC2_FULL_48_10]OGR20660.1 MAG: hypothetical protein A3J85_07305 [Desulfobacula sp. RIFOXYA12_FULL_46_16]
METFTYRFQNRNDFPSDKEILFIPPNGSLKKFDFSIFRIAKYLKDLDIKTSLLSLEPPPENFVHLFGKIYTPKTITEFLDLLGTIPRSQIFYRGWMHAYVFGAFLVKYFPNTIINIKDWNFCDRLRYHFLFGDLSLHDFEGIDYIFKNARVILSHYTEDETDRWAEEHNCSPGKFVFFPELCDEENFCQLIPEKPMDKISLVMASSLPPNNLPVDMFPGKTIFRDTRLLTRKGLMIDFVVPEAVFSRILSEKKLYLDVLYESRFNPNFNLVKGRALAARILQVYHYGVFLFSDVTREVRLFEHAIPSKFALYLEAGLPVLVNDKIKSLARLVEKNGLGIVFSDKKMEELPEKLQRIHHEYTEMSHNVCAFRKEFTYQSFSTLGKLLV